MYAKVFSQIYNSSIVEKPELRFTFMDMLILADQERVPLLKTEELPDRVIVLPRRADTLNQLTRTVKRLIRLAQMD